MKGKRGRRIILALKEAAHTFLRGDFSFQQGIVTIL
jgi:hypothetical protein